MIRTLLARTSLAMAVTAASLLLAALPASAQNRVKAGTLDCDVAGGVGMIIASKKAVRCYFVSNRGGRETYVGSITKFGIDIGITGRGRMIWAVYAPTGFVPYALAGSYAGGSAEASIGAGVGAKILVGGNADTISLQPLSVSAQTGVNLALGVAGLDLRPASPPRRRR